MRVAIFALAAGALALTGCSTSRDLKNTPGYGQKSGNRIDGSRLGGYANPSEVAATDIAFSRAARDDGQWTAFRRYAADGAKIHGKEGVIEAGPWLAARDDPKVPVQWTPVAVWSSCDGSTAVTQGKFADPDGRWGYYVTVWERQDDGRYRWVYDMGAPDDELTAAQNQRRDSAPSGENVIVIRAIEAIEGRVADCPTAEELARPQMRVSPLNLHSSGLGRSQDRSLEWTWTHLDTGRRVFGLSFFKNGEFEHALSFAVNPEGTISHIR